MEVTVASVLAEFAEKMPRGLDTPIPEQGIPQMIELITRLNQASDVSKLNAQLMMIVTQIVKKADIPYTDRVNIPSTREAAVREMYETEYRRHAIIRTMVANVVKRAAAEYAECVNARRRLGKVDHPDSEWRVLHARIKELSYEFFAASAFIAVKYHPSREICQYALACGGKLFASVAYDVLNFGKFKENFTGDDKLTAEETVRLSSYWDAMLTL